MNVQRLLLILLLVVLWGFNFVVIRLGLDGMPPIFLVCVRFFLTAFPAIFFLKRPKVPFYKVVLYGLVMFAIQFSFFFVGMNLGVPPGLASVVLQLHVFFAMLFAVLVFHERITLMQIVGALISFAGIVLAGMNVSGSVTLSGFFCVIAAALFWGTGSAISKTIGKVNMVSLVVWGSMVAWPVLLALSLLMEGPARILASFEHISYTTIGAIVYLTYIATIFGYGTWSWLIHHLPLSTVVPFTMLIPVIALISSMIVLHEPLQSWKIIASALVIGGLAINFILPPLQKGKT